MFKTRYRSTWKRKNKRRPMALITLLLLIGVPVGLELLARLIASMTGFDPHAVSQSAQMQKVQAYQLKFLSSNRTALHPASPYWIAGCNSQSADGLPACSPSKKPVLDD